MKAIVEAVSWHYPGGGKESTFFNLLILHMIDLFGKKKSLGCAKVFVHCVAVEWITPVVCCARQPSFKKLEST